MTSGGLLAVDWLSGSGTRIIIDNDKILWLLMVAHSASRNAVSVDKEHKLELSYTGLLDQQHCPCLIATPLLSNRVR